MQAAFGIVVFAVVGVGVVVALLARLAGGSPYDEIGRGGMSLHEEPRPPRGVAAAAATSPAERSEEIRQMLTARSDRRVRQGRPPLDVELEMARLGGPGLPPGGTDPALTAEVRQLVVARNSRRARRGQAPLDVEEEVARQLAELARPDGGPG